MARHQRTETTDQHLAWMRRHARHRQQLEMFFWATRRTLALVAMAGYLWTWLVHGELIVVDPLLHELLGR